MEHVALEDRDHETPAREEMAHPHLCLDCGQPIPIWCLTNLDNHNFVIRCKSCDDALTTIVRAAREWRFYCVSRGRRSIDAREALERLNEWIVRAYGEIAEYIKAVQ